MQNGGSHTDRFESWAYGVVGGSFMRQLFILWQLHTKHCIYTKAEIDVFSPGSSGLVEETAIGPLYKQRHLFQTGSRVKPAFNSLCSQGLP